MLLNFAHGDIIMVGAYVSWLVMAQLGLPPVLAIILSVAACTLMGVLIDKVAYAPLRNAPRLSILITAIGVSYFLENGAQLVFGADAKVVPAYTELTTVQLGGLSLSFPSILTVPGDGRGNRGAHRGGPEDQARQGHARRVRGHGRGSPHGHQRQHHDLLHLCRGLRARRHRRRALRDGLHPGHAHHGHDARHQGVRGGVLGGIGSIPGAVVGGLLVGFAEVFVTAIGLSVWKDAVVFLLLIIVLVVRPTGIFGRTMSEKV